MRGVSSLFFTNRFGFKCLRHEGSGIGIYQHRPPRHFNCIWNLDSNCGRFRGSTNTLPLVPKKSKTERQYDPELLFFNFDRALFFSENRNRRLVPLSDLHDPEMDKEREREHGLICAELQLREARAGPAVMELRVEHKFADELQSTHTVAVEQNVTKNHLTFAPTAKCYTVPFEDTCRTDSPDALTKRY